MLTQTHASADPALAMPSQTRATDIESVLRDAALLSSDALTRARLAEKETGERFDAVVTRLGLISEEALVVAIAAATGLARVLPSGFPAQPIASDEISPAFLREHRVLPIARDDNGATLAVVNPFDQFSATALGFALQRPITLVLARASDLDAAIDTLYRAQITDDQELAESIDDDDIERLKDLVSDAPIIRAVNRLIAQAVDAHASDIHLEPTEDGLAVRLRVDGMLREMPALPPAMRAPLVSRIKVMADLNIAERRLPQDGRLRLAVRGHDIDLRVATSPSIHGESVVMRILDRSKLALDFETLGFDPPLIAQIRTAIHKPHGIVLVTGPTGSGKTTTLYAALSELNVPERKLLTVEDPIEYRLPGVTQVQVNPPINLTFGTALRSFLRQDPDVMMVGEIRDSETAQIAVQAALTGHMILSTLHTNSAAGAVTRLIDMEIEPFLLSSVLAGVLAQRLVRRLCTHCREPYPASPEMLAELGLAPQSAHLFYRARGCPACAGSGYDGRIGLFELLIVNDAIARLILARAATNEITDAANRMNMRTLRSDGLAKAGLGLTTIEEVLRVSSGD